jgi:hypothetical protein
MYSLRPQRRRRAPEPVVIPTPATGALTPAASYIGLQTTASTGHAAFDDVSVTVP